ncbi:hypothetical protein [Lysinibacillus sp. Bpr_S20]|uniref:type II toxin-antitoxin system HicB family antitoxin n=1 Tax=Lysinibacillus sp. Bpr_S20 TaxID=2933964 RepID=UPI002012AB6E|nr:hypothetical protein [Lysinibacillus sp. Bpr_S20]MCL1700795.1 hypothetical protein [Lysinibacillus sp. Bpr_S20]
MMTKQMLKQLLKDEDKPHLIINETKNGFIVYFRLSPERVGIGKTEIEALNNLKELISAHQKTLDTRGIEELHTRHRKLWNY